MNTCVDVRSQLSLYLDGELGPVERDRVQAHLDRCADCRTIKEELSIADTALGPDIEPAPAPGETEEFIARLRGRIAQELKPRVPPLVLLRTPPRAWSWRFAVAGLATAAVLAIWMWKGGLSGRLATTPIGPSSSLAARTAAPSVRERPSEPIHATGPARAPAALSVVIHRMEQLDEGVNELSRSIDAFSQQAKAESRQRAQEFTSRRFLQWK